MSLRFRVSLRQGMIFVAIMAVACAVGTQGADLYIRSFRLEALSVRYNAIASKHARQLAVIEAEIPPFKLQGGGCGMGRPVIDCFDFYERMLVTRRSEIQEKRIDDFWHARRKYEYELEQKYRRAARYPQEAVSPDPPSPEPPTRAEKPERLDE
jgi:hypothetical protein